MIVSLLGLQYRQGVLLTTTCDLVKEPGPGGLSLPETPMMGQQTDTRHRVGPRGFIQYIDIEKNMKQRNCPSQHFVLRNRAHTACGRHTNPTRNTTSRP